jgi:hypothetical protein
MYNRAGCWPPAPTTTVDVESFLETADTAGATPAQVRLAADLL